MTSDLCKIVPEILGRRSTLGYDPADDSYICPYQNKRCGKQSHSNDDLPYPVCTVTQRKRGYICVCPKRFLEADFLSDVVRNVWGETAPKNPLIASEVEMEGFGKVDYVIVDLDNDGSVNRFISVELQAVDTTGNFRVVYDAIKNNDVPIKKGRGINWLNVYKRYVNQLIAKGYRHQQWENKIVSVIQDQLYEYMQEQAPFMVSDNLLDPTINIVFLVYGYSDEINSFGVPKMKLVKAVGASHGTLQTAVMYKSQLSKTEFERRILSRLAKA